MSPIRPAGVGLVEMYHLVNESIYKVIIQTGNILAFSHPFWRVKVNEGFRRVALEQAGLDFRYVENIMGSDRYIVGFLEAVPVSWIQAGLMKRLLQHIQNKAGNDSPSLPIYSFRMDVPPSQVMVRDSYYISPDYFLDKYGVDYFELFDKSPSEGYKRKEICEGLAKYFNSSMPMVTYLSRGEKYNVPELWYAGDYRLKAWEGVKKLSAKGIEILTRKP